MSDEALELLRALVAGQRALVDQVQALRADLAERRTNEPRADPRTENLLRVIAETVGDRVFTCSDLVAHAAVPTAPDLRAAIIAIAGEASPRKLGRLLRSIEGREIGGFEAHRVGADRDGLIWTVASLRV